MTLRKIEPTLEEKLFNWKELIVAALASHDEDSNSPVGKIEVEGVTPEDWDLMQVADQALVELIAAYEKLQKEPQCTHERTISVGGKTSDMCQVRWVNGKDTDGYAPRIEGLCGGDYIDFVVCIDCGKVLNLASADKILEVQEEETFEEEEEEGW